MVLPRHFKKLEAAFQSPIAAENLVGFKSLTKELLSRFNRTTDFPGCYVFIDGEKPIYVGISRGVMKRLVQHLNYDSHYSASLIFRIASENYPHEMKRDQAMKDEKFKAMFFSAQKRLRQMKIAFVEIDNDLELYLFEVFASWSNEAGHSYLEYLPHALTEVLRSTGLAVKHFAVGGGPVHSSPLPPQ